MEQIVVLLDAFLSVDNQRRAQAETQFSSLKQTNGREVLLCLVAVLSQATAGASDESRKEMSAVLLRGITIREADMWSLMSAEELAQCRVQMLQAVMIEPKDTLRRKIAHTIAAHAKLAPWPELMNGIISLANADTATAKEKQLSLYLLDKLAEYVGPLLVDNLNVVLAIIAPLSSSTGGQELDTRAAAALATCSMLYEIIEPDPRLNALLGDAANIVGQAVQEGREDLAQNVLTAISELVEEKPYVFSTCWEQLLEVLLAICVSPADALEDITVNTSLRIATLLLTKKSSASYCSNPQTRAAFLNAAMNLVAQIDDTEEENQAFYQNRPAEDDYGDTIGEDDSRSVTAARYLDNMATVFDADEIVQVCFAAAWSLVSKEDWRARRAALFVTSIICEGASESMNAFLPQLLPSILSLMSDPHPRVRFSALHCLDELILRFPGEDDDDDDDDYDYDDEDGDEEEGEKEGEASTGNAGALDSFQKRFSSQVPEALCRSIQQEGAYPRIMCMSIQALCSYLNVSVCKSEDVDPSIAGGLIDYFLSLLQTRSCPSFVLEIVLVTLGNLCVVVGRNDSTDAIVRPRYASIIGTLRDTMGSVITNDASTSEASSEVHDLHVIKAKCLECIALVGKAVGKELFGADSLSLLAHLVEAHQRGLDFSTPLASYIVQTCVRIATVLGEDFEPSYLQFLLPPLLERIGKDISVKIIMGDEDSSGGAGEGVTTLKLRGVGKLEALCSHDFKETETMCRVLYQYFLDIPKLMSPYIPACVPNLLKVMGSLAFNDDTAVVIGVGISDSLGIYLKYHHPTLSGGKVGGGGGGGGGSGGGGGGGGGGTPLDTANGMCDMVFKCFVQELERNQLKGGHESKAPSDRNFQLVDSLRETLKIVYEAKCISVKPWALQLDLEICKKLLALLQDEILFWVQRHYISPQILVDWDEEMIKLDGDMRDSLQDAMGWLIKLCGEQAEFAHEFHERTLPTLRAWLASSNKDTDEDFMSVVILLLLDATRYIPSLAPTCATLVFPHLLQHYDAEELTIPCIHGMGLCSVTAGVVAADVSAYVGPSILAVFRALNMNISAEQGPPLDLDFDEYEQQVLADNAVSCLFKLCVAHSEVLGAGSTSQLLSLALTQMPIVKDKIEAKELHQLLIGLFIARDVRLLGPSLEHLTPVLTVLMQLVSAVGGSISTIEPEMEDEYWSKQLVSKQVFEALQNDLTQISSGADAVITPSVLSTFLASLGSTAGKKKGKKAGARRK